LVAFVLGQDSSESALIIGAWGMASIAYPMVLVLVLPVGLIA
jgi:hypothetical protein